MPFDYALWGKLAGLVSVAGYLPYLFHMRRTREYPQRTTWLIWTVVGGILFWSYRASGATHTLWVPLVGFLGPGGLWLISLKWGVGGWTREDRWCLLGAGISLVVWALTGKPEVALAMNILVDTFGAYLTVKKAWLAPHSESRWAWAVWFAANTLNVLVVDPFTLVLASYPVYAALAAAAIAALTWRPHLHRP